MPRLAPSNSKASERAGITKPATPHTLYLALAIHPLQAGHDVCTVQEMLGHAGVATTEIYTHVLNLGSAAIRGPIDTMSLI